MNITNITAKYNFIPYKNFYIRSKHILDLSSGIVLYIANEDKSYNIISYPEFSLKLLDEVLDKAFNRDKPNVYVSARFDLLDFSKTN